MQNLFENAKQWHFWFLAGVGSGVLLSPLFYHYYLASRELGYWGFGSVFWLLPAWQSWFYHGQESLLYFWQNKIKIFQMIPIPDEKKLGMGIVFTFCAFLGLWRSRFQTWGKPLLWGTVFIIVVTTLYPKGFTMWEPFHDFFPGAKAIRGICRIGLFVSFPMVLGFLFFLKSQKINAGFFILVAFTMAEQVRRIPSYNAVRVNQEVNLLTQAIQRKFDMNACDAFFISPSEATVFPGHDQHDYERNAMWASFSLNKPTVNGYNSRPPRNWNFSPNWISTSQDVKRLQEALDAWSVRHRLTAKRICWYYD